MYVKLCGITDAAQVPELVRIAPSALGINLIPSSKRYVPLPRAWQLVECIRAENIRQAKDVECVAVISADQPPPELVSEGSGVRVESLLGAASFDRIQLHSSRPAATWQALGAPSQIFLAAQIADVADVERASELPGAPLLVDAKLGDSLGGTGHSFDWSLVEALAARRELLLAGGLDARKLPRAIAQVKPWGVDVASGVESGEPGIKDVEKCAAFVDAARAAAVAVEKRS
ncbi:MAG: phosphoribosylanthranilate isomerase [Myxococcales bacterium]|nr:phosphoribosylanthranilate isomerase [Myxococcales bacterium]